LSSASNWIGVQTGVHGFDSRTPHEPVVSKTSEAGGCRRTTSDNISRSERVRAFYSTRKKLIVD